MATAKRAWSETLKQKLNSILRISRKPFVRPKKEKPPPIKVKEVEEKVKDDDDSDSGTPTAKPAATTKEKEVKETAFAG